jgi:DNA-binding response OmpR family regulator
LKCRPSLAALTSHLPNLNCPLNILLADDNPSFRQVLAAIVRRSGHTVVKAAADGTEAWEAFEELRPPMLLLDWEMPGLSGIEVCGRVRASEDGDVPFIIMVTGREGSENLKSVLDAGADDYVSKPITPDGLQARLRIAERRIEVLAGRRRAEEALRKAQYLAGIGQTTLALQHEINNPLAALLLHASLLEQGMVEGAAGQAENLATIVVQARRIADVVKRLQQLENPTSVEYLGSQRMLDIRAEPRPPKDG